MRWLMAARPLRRAPLPMTSLSGVLPGVVACGLLLLLLLLLRRLLVEVLVLSLIPL